MAVAGAEHAGQRRCCALKGQSRAQDSNIGVASDCRDGAVLASKNSKQSCQEHETGDEASFLWLWQLRARRALQEAGKRNSSVAL